MNTLPILLINLQREERRKQREEEKTREINTERERVR